MKEIGGYLELERMNMPLYHEGLIPLNCGRGCLRYLVELRGISSIWMPDFMCGSVISTLSNCGVKIKFYSVSRSFKPDFEEIKTTADDWLFVADYYGQLSHSDVEQALFRAAGRVIVDESQGYYRSPWEGADTLYTCRKWFGVADGAFLYTSDGAKLARTLPRDESYNRMEFVLGRFERSASEFYALASENNDFFDGAPVKQMSPITDNLLRGIDYETVKRRRNDNWRHLDDRLRNVNELEIHDPEVAFMYPLYLGERAQEIRRSLISEKVYIPILWPDAKNASGASSMAEELSRNILPLPVDQRYDPGDMGKVLQLLVQNGVSVG